MNLIENDIRLMRDRYDEALALLGTPAKYQYPILPDSDNQGAPRPDSYSIPEDIHIFFESTPKLKTIKRLGWVVENNKDLPFLIHCSFNLPNLQKDCIFELSGHYTNVKSRKFRVTQLTTDLQAPDHVTVQVVPCYDEVVGHTDTQIANKYNKSNHFISQNVDYRGDYYDRRK